MHAEAVKFPSRLRLETREIVTAELQSYEISAVLLVLQYTSNVFKGSLSVHTKKEA